MDRNCWMCGNPGACVFTEKVVSESHRVYCQECYQKYFEKFESDKQEYLRLKKKLMVERAIRILERQNILIDEYKEAIDAVSEYSSENLDKFDSAHEIVSAIILIDNEIDVKTQFKVGKYRADFCLPTLKVIFEVDGERHRTNLYRDNQRDIFIRHELGDDWEIVRIKTEYIEQNAEMLVEAIKEIKKEKQKIRRQNGGLLPEWYSERNRAKKPKRLDKSKYGDELLLD